MTPELEALMIALQPFLKVAHRKREQMTHYADRATEVVVRLNEQEVEANIEEIVKAHPELGLEQTKTAKMADVLSMDSIIGQDWLDVLNIANMISPFKDPIDAMSSVQRNG